MKPRSDTVVGAHDSFNGATKMQGQNIEHKSFNGAVALKPTSVPVTATETTTAPAAATQKNK